MCFHKALYVLNPIVQKEHVYCGAMVLISSVAICMGSLIIVAVGPGPPKHGGGGIHTDFTSALMIEKSKFTKAHDSTES